MLGGDGVWAGGGGGGGRVRDRELEGVVPNIPNHTHRNVKGSALCHQGADGISSYRRSCIYIVFSARRLGGETVVSFDEILTTPLSY